MQIVIDIPDKAYEELCNANFPIQDAYRLVAWIKNGTPLPKGHWIKTPKAVMGEGYMWYCDKCQYEVYQDTSKNYPSEKYCPNCGAKMVEPQESEDKE